MVGALISAPGECRGRAFWPLSVDGLVSGIDQLLHPNKKAHDMSAATMPLASGLQVRVLLPHDMGTVGVVGAVWSSASTRRPKRRPRSSEARARVKRRAAQWWCMSMAGHARACWAWLW